MKTAKNLLLTLLLVVSSANAESTMTSLSQAKDVLAEIWCVAGHKVFYVEKTTNGNFQFFQLTKNGGMAPKMIECDGSEVKFIGNGK
jgi:hypothetical protein